MLAKSLTVKFSVDEVKALLTLAENQIFREKFIDPKFPGHKSRPEEHGLAAVKILKAVLVAAKEIPDHAAKNLERGLAAAAASTRN